MTSLTREILESASADAFLETDLKNIRYLSGFCGTTAVILVLKHALEPVLITDARYYGSIRNNTRGLFRAVESNDFAGSILQLCESAKVKTLAYNGDYLTVSGLNRLKKRLGKIRMAGKEDI
ncbi:MAG: aminopeptidase P family N-terminal domain-containing protein, partial [Candidatus Aureabacteria bacterium]|nr:aminopeptidase P family N-terminal domain-containing protein [Candidatus Auribacterota bacterium]